MDTGQINTATLDGPGRVKRQVRGGEIVPLSKYDPQYGGKPNSAVTAMAAMQKEYGQKKGTSVFYALKNKRLKSGAVPAPRA